jgi:hypothetical protein
MTSAAPFVPGKEHLVRFKKHIRANVFIEPQLPSDPVDGQLEEFTFDANDELRVRIADVTADGVSLIIVSGGEVILDIPPPALEIVPDPLD